MSGCANLSSQVESFSDATLQLLAKPFNEKETTATLAKEESGKNKKAKQTSPINTSTTAKPVSILTKLDTEKPAKQQVIAEIESDLLQVNKSTFSTPAQQPPHFLDYILSNHEEPKAGDDYSEYGFITPSASLEEIVNTELGSLRDNKTLSPEANLFNRIRKGFKLDLELDNRRIQAQLKWYVNNPDYLTRTFNRSARYLFYIVEELEKRDLPQELALLPLVESAFDPFAYSHGRASGLWQFIPGTAKMYGMHQNWWYDGRRDVLASTQGAINYLSHLNKVFKGDWLHALASYNSGSGRVGKAIKKNRKRGKPTDFWSLKLPRETRAYVPKLLAISKVVADPEKYNIVLPSIENKPYFSVVKTGSQLDLAQAASMANIDIQELYKLNPGYNQWATAPLGPHRLLVPIENAEEFNRKLAELSPKQRLTWNRYSVRSGDSLIKIAKKFNTTPKLIKQVNRLSSNTIRVKQKLLIPVASKGKQYYGLSEQNRLKNKQSKIKQLPNSSKVIHVVKAGDTIWDLSREHKVSVRSIAKWNGMAPRDVLKPGQKLLIWSKAHQAADTAVSVSANIPDRNMIKRIGYRVKRGDSLARIANKFSVKIKDLIAWNKLDKKKYLQPGQKLTIYVDITRG